MGEEVANGLGSRVPVQRGLVLLTATREIDFRYATSLILIQQGHSWVALGQPDQARTFSA